MPDMDGFNMLRKLKGLRETSHIPSIFLTAKDTSADKEMGYSLGVDSYLTKPVSPKLLNRRIENLLLKRKTLYTEILNQLSGDRDDAKVNPQENKPKQNKVKCCEHYATQLRLSSARGGIQGCDITQ